MTWSRTSPGATGAGGRHQAGAGPVELRSDPGDPPATAGGQGRRGHRSGPAATSGTGSRFPGVEGLRAVAAGGVLLSHVWLSAGPDGQTYDLGPATILARTVGGAGVTLFFTLSGFLLYRPYAAAVLTGRPRPRTRTYLRNRFLRIAPAYWLALLVTGLVLRTTYLPPGQVEGRSLASDPAALAANLVLAQNYSPRTMLTGIGPAWSLAIELVFYLALPVLALGVVLLVSGTRGGARWPWAAALLPAAVLFVIGECGQYVGHRLPRGSGTSWEGSWQAVVLRGFLAQCGLFAGGLALAVLHTQVERGRLRLPRRWRLATASAALALAVPAFVLADAHRLPEHRMDLAVTVSCTLLLALVVLPVSSGPSGLVRVLACWPLRSVGLISYGVFLWQEPLIHWLRRAGATGTGVAGFAGALLLTVAVSVAAATLSWFTVERTALAVKRPAAGVDTRGGLGTDVPADAPPAASPLDGDDEQAAGRSPGDARALQADGSGHHRQQ